jgi:hypothetical protein
LTLKASIGQQTLRVMPTVALESFKPGDKVLITFGQIGEETVITPHKSRSANALHFRYENLHHSGSAR